MKLVSNVHLMKAHEGDVQNPCLDHIGSRSRSCLKVKGLSLYFVSAPYIQDSLKDFHETCIRCSPHEGNVQNPCLDHTGSRSRLKVKSLSLFFVSAPYLKNDLKDFHEIYVSCSPHQGDVQNPCLDYMSSRSRSCLKVKSLNLDFVTAPYLQHDYEFSGKFCQLFTLSYDRRSNVLIVQVMTTPFMGCLLMVLIYILGETSVFVSKTILVFIVFHSLLNIFIVHCA